MEIRLEEYEYYIGPGIRICDTRRFLIPCWRGELSRLSVLTACVFAQLIRKFLKMNLDLLDSGNGGGYTESYWREYEEENKLCSFAFTDSFLFCCMPAQQLVGILLVDGK